MKEYLVGVIEGKGKKIEKCITMNTDDLIVRVESIENFLNMVSYSTFANVVIVDGEIKTTNGDIKRYFRANMDGVITDTCFILKRLFNGTEIVGYLIWENTNGVKNYTTAEALELGRIKGFSNAKVVNSSHISAISGEFESEDVNDTQIKLGEEVSLAQFLILFKRRGCSVKRVGNTYDIGCGHSLEFDCLNTPHSNDKEAIKIKLNMPIKIKNLGMISDKVMISFNADNYIENVHILKSIEVDYLAKVNIGQCIIGSLVKTIKSVQIAGEVGRFIAQEGALERIESSFNSMNTEEIDLSKCNGDLIRSSFNIQGGKKVKVMQGNFKHYTGVFKGSGSIELGMKFTNGVKSIDGFTNITNITELDLSECKKLTALGGMSVSSIKKIIIPDNEGMKFGDNFLQYAEIDRIDIPGKYARISRYVCSNTRIVCVRNDAIIDVTQTDERKGVYLVKGEKISCLPRLEHASKVENNYVRIAFEEGTETIRKNYDNRFDSNQMAIRTLIFPSSVREIGKEAFSSITIADTNIESSNIEVIGERAFKGSVVGKGILILPKTLRSVGDRALESAGIVSFYIPETVEIVGKAIASNSIVYMHKNSEADKKLGGTLTKIYIDSVEEVKAILDANKNTERQSAKIKMALENREDYKWMKEEEYKDRAKFILDVELALDNTSVATENIQLDTSQFIDFNIEGLGKTGEIIREYINNRREDYGVKQLTNRFKVISNIITANTKFYAGHFTAKALKVFEDAESFNIDVVYADYLSAIATIKIPKESGKETKDMFCVIITFENKIKYTTVLNSYPFFGLAEILYGYEVERFIGIGDVLPSENGKNIAIGNQKLPKHINEKFIAYCDSSINKLDSTKNLMISYSTGKAYHVKETTAGLIVDGILEPKEHRYESDKKSFDQSMLIEYFDIVNGKQKTEKRVMEPKKARLLRALEKIRGKYKEPSYESFRALLDELTDVEINIDKQKLTTYYSSKVFNHSMIRVVSGKVMERFGFSLENNTASLFAYKEGSNTTNVKVTPYKLSNFVELWDKYKVDNSVQAPIMFKTVTSSELSSLFMEIKMESSGFRMGIAKNNGLVYLIMRMPTYNTPSTIEYKVVGIIRDDEEAYKVFNGGLSSGEDLEGFKLADKARRGLIPVGAHIEYTAESRIYELLGL